MTFLYKCRTGCLLVFGGAVINLLISSVLMYGIVSVPARLGKGQGAKEIGHNLAHERPKFWHNLVRKRHKIGHSLERE